MTEYVVRYRSEAEAEISNAYLWLETQVPELGERLLLELERLDARIAENPFMFQVVLEPEIRSGLTRRFPYSLFYRVTGMEVDVLACFHQRQRPRRREELLTQALVYPMPPARVIDCGGRARLGERPPPGLLPRRTRA